MNKYLLCVPLSTTKQEKLYDTWHRMTDWPVTRTRNQSDGDGSQRETVPCPLPLLPANTFIIITIIRWTEWCLQCDPDHYSSVLQNENVFTNVCVYLLYRIRNIYLQETTVTKTAVHYLTFLIFRRVRDGGWLGPAERGRGPSLHPPACEQNLVNCQSAFIFITVRYVT